MESLLLLDRNTRRTCPSPVEVRIHDIHAACSCGASRFFPAGAPPYRSDASFTCELCGAAAGYGALLERIGEEAMRRAHEAIMRLKRQAGERRGAVRMLSNRPWPTLR